MFCFFLLLQIQENCFRFFTYGCQSKGSLWIKTIRQQISFVIVCDSQLTFCSFSFTLFSFRRSTFSTTNVSMPFRRTQSQKVRSGLTRRWSQSSVRNRCEFYLFSGRWRAVLFIVSAAFFVTMVTRQLFFKQLLLVHDLNACCSHTISQLAWQTAASEFHASITAYLPWFNFVIPKSIESSLKLPFRLSVRDHLEFCNHWRNSFQSSCLCAEEHRPSHSLFRKAHGGASFSSFRSVLTPAVVNAKMRISSFYENADFPQRCRHSFGLTPHFLYHMGWWGCARKLKKTLFLTPHGGGGAQAVFPNMYFAKHSGNKWRRSHHYGIFIL